MALETAAACLATLFHRERAGEGQEVELAVCEIMASFILVEHANGAMFDPPGARDLAADGCAESQAVPHGYIAVLI